MRPRRYRSKLIFLSIFVLAHPAGLGQERTQAPKSANAAYDLSNDQMTALIGEANKGDANAAMRLAFYFDFVTKDHNTAHVWLKKAADSGNAKAQFNLGVRTIGKGGSGACEEAKRWFLLAKDNGFAHAERELDRIGTCG